MHTKLPKKVFSKTHHFSLPDFRKIQEMVFFFINFKANCLSRHDQKVYSIFSKSCPSGYQFFFQIAPKWKEVSIGMDSLLTMVTNSFENPIIKTWKHFFFYFMIMKFILLSRNISKIHNDKRRPKQVYSFHANADIKAKFTFFKKCIRKWKHS